MSWQSSADGSVSQLFLTALESSIQTSVREVKEHEKFNLEQNTPFTSMNSKLPWITVMQ